MQTKLFAFLFLAVALVACKPKSGQQEAPLEEQDLDRGNVQIQQERWDDVMTIHDDVMPKMSEVNRLTEALKTRLPEATGEQQTQIQAVITDLEAADKAMWDWMYGLKQLNELRDSLQHEQIVSYLEGQEKSIAQVKDQIETAIQKAHELLPENG